MMAHWREECRSRRTLRDLFVDGRVTGPADSFGDHLAKCQACRELASELARADRAFGQACGSDAGLSVFEAALVWHRLSDQLAVSRPQGRRVLWSILAPVVAGLAGLALVAWTLFWSGPRTAGPSADGDAASRGVPITPSIQLICIQPGVGAARPADVGGASRCLLDQTLGFTYLNPGGRYRGLVLFAVDEDGQVLWYQPNPSEPVLAELAPAERPRALARTVELAVNHRTGAYRIVAVFTPEPLDLEAARGLVPGRPDSNRPGPGHHRVEHRLEIGEASP